ncbi:hypothetical protein DYE20_14725 [[Mycobacterium] chelonae subsp. gwanakae]|nr:hypothetical protein DYE20_14725 [[Mycobacterium] chelonae subsp. gwanakae]
MADRVRRPRRTWGVALPRAPRHETFALTLCRQRWRPGTTADKIGVRQTAMEGECHVRSATGG